MRRRHIRPSFEYFRDRDVDGVMIAGDLTDWGQKAQLKMLADAWHSVFPGDRHPSGKKLSDLAEIVLDNGAPYGDAVGEIDGFPQKVGPVSTVGGCACWDAVIAETVQMLVNANYEPPVFMSANMDGGDEFNARKLRENASRIFYMN